MSAFAAILLLATLGGSSSTRAPEIAGSMGTRLLSPSVEATWIVRGDPNAPPELELLVLWRGSPGWMMREGASESTGGGIHSGREGDRGSAFATLSFGEVQLKLEFDGNTRVARVGGIDVNLGSDDVILVDEVDGPAGPRIAGTSKVDAQVSEEPGRDIEVVIRSNWDLYDFLRCEAPGPDAAIQPMIDEMCARMKPS